LKKHYTKTERKRTKMKKILLLTLIAFFWISSLRANYKLFIDFKNGAHIEYEAKSYWTSYDYYHNYYYYLGDNIKEDTNYLCFHDNCAMNPVSYDTKKADYTDLRDKIQATGNECNFSIEQHTTVDWWCISIRYDQIDLVEYSESSHRQKAYEKGVKYNLHQ